MTIKLKITGMTCNHCRATVQKALSGVEGTSDVQVHLEAGTAVVQGHPKPDQLIAAVKEEGYSAEIA
jgi:copper chaperone